MIRQLTEQEHTDNLRCDVCGVSFELSEKVVEWMLFFGDLVIHSGCALYMTGRLRKHVLNNTSPDGHLNTTTTVQRKYHSPEFKRYETRNKA